MQLQSILYDGYGLSASKIVHLGIGLIHRTYDVDGGYILQRVNAIFDPCVNEDIEALGGVLRARDVVVPRLMPTRTGAFGFIWRDRSHWRLMEKLPGDCFERVGSMAQIRSLTLALLGFHSALKGEIYVFKHSRGGVHDFKRHMDALESALASYQSHVFWGDVMRLYRHIEAMGRHVDPISTLSCEVMRIVHGDPKVSNFLFCGDEVSGILDLDTMAYAPVACDIGDAVRSWCNPRREDETPEFQREYAREVVGLYIEQMRDLTREEREKLPRAGACIALELGVRFARDALCEDYFGFDPAIGHARHSLLRAQAQVSLCEQMLHGREV